MEDMFTFIGIITVYVVSTLLIVLLIKIIHEFIDGKRYEYRRKHRFDKPPTAKCYCVDCKYWEKDNGRCLQFKDYHTADFWFCCDAEPMTLKEYNRRESE